MSAPACASAAIWTMYRSRKSAICPDGSPAQMAVGEINEIAAERQTNIDGQQTGSWPDARSGNQLNPAAAIFGQYRPNCRSWKPSLTRGVRFATSVTRIRKSAGPVPTSCDHPAGISRHIPVHSASEQLPLPHDRSDGPAVAAVGFRPMTEGPTAVKLHARMTSSARGLDSWKVGPRLTRPPRSLARRQRGTVAKENPAQTARAPGQPRSGRGFSWESVT